MGYMNLSASGKSCICNPKDKSKWYIIGRTGKKKTVQCIVCRCQWDTNAKYLSDLKSTMK